MPSWRDMGHLELIEICHSVPLANSNFGLRIFFQARSGGPARGRRRFCTLRLAFQCGLDWRWPGQSLSFCFTWAGIIPSALGHGFFPFRRPLLGFGWGKVLILMPQAIGGGEGLLGSVLLYYPNQPPHPAIHVIGIL